MMYIRERVVLCFKYLVVLINESEILQSPTSFSWIVVKYKYYGI